MPKPDSPPVTPIRRDPSEPVTQFDDPAVAKEAELRAEKQPAQVSPQKKRVSEHSPEDVPPPGDMGPPEGPGS